MPMTGLFDVGVTVLVFAAAALLLRRTLRRNNLIL